MAEMSAPPLPVDQNLQSDGRLTLLPVPKFKQFQTKFPKSGKIDLETHGAVKVNVRVRVMNILEVSPVHETFTAIFVLQFYYVDPALRDFESEVWYSNGNGDPVKITGRIVGSPFYDNRTELVIQTSTDKHTLKPTNVMRTTQPDWSSGKYFQPEWSMMNIVGQPTELLHRRQLEYCSASGGHVSDKYKFQATFKERFELRDMPFDRQILRMKFVAEIELFSMQFAPLQESAGDFKGGTRPDVPDEVPIEWQIDEKLKARLMVTKPDEKSGNLARFDVLIHLQRKPAFYQWNVIFVLFFVTLGSASVFRIDHHSVAKRASVLLTLLLTTVGYKLITAQWMPVKPYLTFLDKYILASFVLQFLTITERIVVVWLLCGMSEEHDCALRIADFEKIFAVVLYGVWIAWHFLFFLSPRFAVWLMRFYFFRRCLGRRCFGLPTRLTTFWRWLQDPCVSWEEVYKENRVLLETQVLQPNSSGHPYGVADPAAPETHTAHRSDGEPDASEALRRASDVGGSRKGCMHVDAAEGWAKSLYEQGQDLKQCVEARLGEQNGKLDALALLVQSVVGSVAIQSHGDQLPGDQRREQHQNLVEAFTEALNIHAQRSNRRPSHAELSGSESAGDDARHALLQRQLSHGSPTPLPDAQPPRDRKLRRSQSDAPRRARNSLPTEVGSPESGSVARRHSRNQQSSRAHC